jgi:hypothetical protein
MSRWLIFTRTLSPRRPLQGRFWDMHELLFHRQKALGHGDLRGYGDVYRRVEDGDPKVLVILTAETALLTGSALFIERTSAGGSGLVADEQKRCVSGVRRWSASGSCRALAMGAAPSPSETDAPYCRA